MKRQCPFPSNILSVVKGKGKSQRLWNQNIPNEDWELFRCSKKTKWECVWRELDSGLYYDSFAERKERNMKDGKGIYWILFDAPRKGIRFLGKLLRSLYFCWGVSRVSREAGKASVNSRVESWSIFILSVQDCYAKQLISFLFF